MTGLDADDWREITSCCAHIVQKNSSENGMRMKRRCVMRNRGIVIGSMNRVIIIPSSGPFVEAPRGFEGQTHPGCYRPGSWQRMSLCKSTPSRGQCQPIRLRLLRSTDGGKRYESGGVLLREIITQKNAQRATAHSFRRLPESSPGG